MPQRRRSYRWLWGGGILIVVAIIIAVVIVVVNNNVKNDNQEEETVKVEELTEEKKKEKEETTEPEVKKEPVSQYDGDDPNAAESLTGVVSYAGANGSNLIVRANIDQYLASGTCTLNLSRNGTIIYSETVGIEASVATSTCNGFSVMTSQIGGGYVNIEINLNSDGKYGKIVGGVDI